jgi:hypothetical protein
MIRSALLLVLGLFAAAALVAGVSADDKKSEAKEMKYEGTVTCAKCDLGKADKCATVIKVKDEIYYFDDASHKKYHGKVCNSPMEGTVYGTVTEKDGKKIVKVTKVEYK